ncbi:hypothetical protein AKO1_007430, partial [Acrasis kona]
MSHTLMVSKSENDYSNISSIPITADMVTYHKTTSENQSFVPVSFLLDTTIEFSLISYQMGLYLQFNRSLNEPIVTLHTRFGSFQGVLRMITVRNLPLENDLLISQWNVPVVWNVLKNGPDCPLLGRRGMFPNTFVEMGGSIHTHNLYRIHHHLITSYLPHIKRTIPCEYHKVTSDGNTTKTLGSFLIDTLSLKSNCFSFDLKQLPVVFNSSQSLHTDTHVHLTISNKEINSTKIDGVLGWDFIGAQGVLLYQGHPLFGSHVEEKDDQSCLMNKFLEQYNPLETCRLCFSLFYKERSG